LTSSQLILQEQRDSKNWESRWLGKKVGSLGKTGGGPLLV